MEEASDTASLYHRRRRQSLELISSGNQALEWVATLKKQLANIPSFSSIPRPKGLDDPPVTFNRQARRASDASLTCSTADFLKSKASHGRRNSDTQLIEPAIKANLGAIHEADELNSTHTLSLSQYDEEEEREREGVVDQLEDTIFDVADMRVELRQLKDLLANAFDDIDADETCSLASDESHDSGRHSDEIGQQQWPNGRLSQHASTPVSESRAPPLITPMIHRRFSSPAPSTTGHLNAYAKQNSCDNLHQEPDHTAMISYDSNLTQQSDNDGTAYHQTIFQHSPNEYYCHQYPTPNQTSGSYPPSQTSHHSGSDYGRGHQHSNGGGVQHSPHCHSQQAELSQGQQQHCQQTQSSYSNIHNTGTQQMYGERGEQAGGSEELDNTVFAEAEPQRNHSEQLQDRYFQEGPGSKNTQLEILYQAKSRQLQELQEKYELIQLESSKDMRVLRHQVALLEGDKQGCEASNTQLQSLLSQNKEARFELQKRLGNVEEQNQQFECERNELREQLKSAEASIESLNAQIFALGSSDTIERMREQHENIITSLQQEQERERNELNTMLSNLRNQLDQQTESVQSEKLNLRADTEALAKERLDHADTVNRLTESLKESQRQVQELLSESCGADLSRLKIQLQQSVSSKLVTEQLCDTLQKEMSDLKEQINLYESARNAEVYITSSSTPHHGYTHDTSDTYDDTLVELGIKPLNNNKSSGYGSLTSSSKKTQDTEETILILRRELQKCLGVVKDKRVEISTLRTELNQKAGDYLKIQTELDVLRDKYGSYQLQLKEAHIELNLYKSAAKDGNSLLEIKLKSQVDILTRERTLLEEEVKTITERLELIAGNEAKLEEINAELNSKMSEMVDDFDRDKKAALDRCQQTLENHNQTVREMMRSELESEFDMKLKRFEGHYQSDLTKLRASEKDLSAELTQVKDLYVQVCSEKTALEEKFSQCQLTITELDKKHETITQQERQLHKRVAELEEDNSSLTCEKNELNIMIEKLRTQFETCQQENESFRGFKDRSKEQLSDLSTSLSACRELFTDNQSAERSKSSNQSLSKSGRASANLSRDDGGVRSLEEQLRNKTNEQLNLHDELLRSRSETQTEVSAHSESKKEITRLQLALAGSKSRLEETKRELTGLQAEITQLKVIIEDLRTDNHKLDTLLSAERIQLSLAKDDVITLQGEVSELRLTQIDDGTLGEKLHDLNTKLADSMRQAAKVQGELDTETLCHEQATKELERLRKCVATEKESHSQTKEDLERVRKNLTCEKDSHNTARKTLLNLQNDLQNEKKLHQLTKLSMDRKEAALQAEMTAHNQAKIDVSKLQTELSEEKANKSHSDSMDKTELIKLQAELDGEKRSHSLVKQDLEKLENSLRTEKTSQSLALNSIENLQRDLESEKQDHQQTREELNKSEAELETERANHNKCKIDLVTLEAELSTERSNQCELRQSLSKVKTTHSEQEAQLEVLRSNQRKDTELITQLKNQKTQDKNQLDGLKASHCQVVADLNESKAELIRKASEMSQLKAGNTRLLAEIDSLTVKHTKEKNRLMEEHRISLQSTLEEAKQRWSQEAADPSADVLAENKLLKEKINSLESDVQNYEKLLSQADEHFEQQLNKMRQQLTEEHKDITSKLSGDLKRTEKSLEYAETETANKDSMVRQLKQEIVSLNNKIDEAESKCKEYRGCTDELRRNLQSMSSQTDLLKTTNKKLQSELSKTASSYDNKLDNLSHQLQYKTKEISRMEHEHDLTVQSLKQKMVALRNEQSFNNSSSVRQTRSCQTPVPDYTAKQLYDSTVMRIRADVLSYVEETNKNAAKLIKAEIHKAKQSTARQLRNYYVRCFKQSINDHRSSNEEKLSKLERTLDNAIASVVTPTNINTDSILSVPEQLLNESLSIRPSSQASTTINNNQPGVRELYSRVDTTQSDRQTPQPTLDSKFSYVPLRQSAASQSRNRTPTNTDTSSIIRELGLDNTETSPPRWYNPPPEKLDPSPPRRSYPDNKSKAKFASSYR